MEPHRTETTTERRKTSEPTPPRFRIEKLEERIAPRYFYNEHAGKYVGHYRYCRRCYR